MGETIDYTFMFAADVPQEHWGAFYGVLRRVRKKDNHVDPFRLARGEAGAIGDDGTLRWELHLGKGGKHFLSAGCNDDDNLSHMLTGISDECIVLVPLGDIARLEEIQDQIALDVIHYNGSLVTNQQSS